MTIRTRLAVSAAVAVLLAAAAASGVAQAAPVNVEPSVTVALDGVPGWGVLSPDGSHLYVTVSNTAADGSQIAGEVDVVDTSTNSVTTRIPVGAIPMASSINATGTRLYVPNSGDGTVSIIDTPPIR